MSALHPHTAKAETARARPPTRAAVSQDKNTTRAASLAKGRRGREDRLNAAPVTSIVEE